MTEPTWSMPSEVERAFYGSERRCAVCGEESHIWLYPRTGMPPLGFCDTHEPESGWGLADGFGPLRDGSMTVRGNR